MNRRAQFDAGPLSWVKGEIDLSMQRGLESLRAIAAGDAAQIKLARAHLHQAHGALQIVGLDGVTRVSEELEALLADIESGGAGSDALAAAEHGFDGLCVYLDGLTAGTAHPPLQLLPLYRELRAARTAEVAATEADAVDLYFPNLGFRPPWREKVPVQLHPEDAPRFFREQRLRYQRGFLFWIKGESSGAAEMHAALEAIEQTQGPAAQRTFWWVATACLGAIASGALAEVSTTELRRLCMRIEAQLRGLIEGSTNITERAMRELLYVLAQASPQPGDEALRQALETCQLEGTIPRPGDATAEAAVAPDLRPAREQLALAEEAWSRYAAEGDSGGESLKTYTHAVTEHARHAAQLGNPDLAALAEQLSQTGRALLADDSKMSEAIALETATALLFLENALENLAADPAALGEDFSEQSRFLRERLGSAIAGKLLRTAPDIPLLDEMSRQAQERLVTEQVVVEMQANLRSIEEVLDAFFRDPSRRDSLSAIAKPLHQLTGALEMLGEASAHDALAESEAIIARFSDVQRTPQQEEFESVARSLSALGFHIAAIGRGEASDFDTVLHPRRAQARPEEVDAPEAAAEPTPQAEPETAPQVPPQAPPQAAPDLPPAAAEPAAGLPDETVDPELLVIFLEEADEVLANVTAQLARLQAHESDHEALVNIRRGFHTLKGSGRMVGLNRLGEAAWTVEQALNWWLREQRPASAPVLELVDQARAWFTDNVAMLKTGGRTGDANRLAMLADAVKSGKPVAPLPVAEEPPAETFPATDMVADIAASAAEASAHAQTLPPVAAPQAVHKPAPEPEENTVRLGETSITTTVFTLFSGEAHALMNTLRGEYETLKIHGIVTDEMLRAAHTLAGIAGTVQLTSLSVLGRALEGALEVFAKDAVGENEQELTGEAIETLGAMVESAVELREPQAAHSLVARLEEAALPRVQDMPPPVVFYSDPDALLPEEEGVLKRVEDHPETQPVPAADAVAEAVNAAFAPDAPAAAAADSAEPATAEGMGPRMPQRREQRLRDELDAQLLPVFLEEAAELIPAIAADLRGWRQALTDTDGAASATLAWALQRRLHTLKGSARMAGAMAIGDLTHHMETRIEASLKFRAQPPLDELDASFDRLAMLFDGLRQPDAATAAADDTAAAQAPGPVAAVEEGAALGAAMLRVRADAVDRMVNQTGEVSIARSRIEGELRGLKAAMQELTDNVLRLRSQLREIEIQAESQMQAAGHKQAPVQANEAGQKEGFDPLEFDRFTRFQELTRIMAESVNDVQTVHQNLLRAVEGTDAALAAQARLNRELQQELMRVRMVAFGTLSERLYRVVRQTAKDAGKRANLDIRGTAVELDRAVLERITAPVEHVLRNSVTHGIEAPDARAAAGKPEIGDIRIEVSQEGSEMRLAIADDGAGLDLARIRAKAEQAGLLRQGIQPSDEELADLIFHPGFSTASELTQSAGRGVGMDVVRSEVAGLGGRVELHTEQGKGLAVTLYLPLTLAVTQVVLVRVREQLFALPAVIVEQVMQYRPEQLASLYGAGQVEWRGRRYPLHYLPHLLGEPAATPEPRRLAAVILMRSGASAIALHVDEIVGGNQEVVVKAIGPQLQRVPGVSGATVLGSGAIVLIINPVPLAARQIGLSQDIAAQKAAAVAPVPAAPVPPLILVVDDSLTVRKITGRLLERQGYGVVTARDGLEALEKLAESPPDVMLVDIEMPRMDGFELTRHVRANAALAGLPIIMISSRTADKHRNVAHQLGVNAFLGKPYQEDELLAHIASLLPQVRQQEAIPPAQQQN